MGDFAAKLNEICLATRMADYFCYILVPSNRLILVEHLRYILRAHKNSMNMTRITAENLMFEIIVTHIAPMQPKLICVESKHDLGRASSTLPISFANRFMMRPLGFKSKKRIFVETNPRNIESCSFCEAVPQKLKNVNDLDSATMNKDAIIPA